MKNFDDIKVGEKIIFRSYGDSFNSATVVKVTATTFTAKIDGKEREITFMKRTGDIRGEKSLYEYAINFDQQILNDAENRKRRAEALSKIENFNFRYLKDSQLDKILAILDEKE